MPALLGGTAWACSSYLGMQLYFHPQDCINAALQRTLGRTRPCRPPPATHTCCHCNAPASACRRRLSTVPIPTDPRSYNRILAPTLRVFEDRRINLRQVDLDYDLS